MVTEYIKRNQKMGYDENGVLLYKVPADEVAPAVEEVIAPAPEPVVEETPPAEDSY